ncbi:hypothetical protein PI124_g21120 [Phytophthora idaei]|nr:hypothetical protein PI125_g23048 [Phytophthora idaei]KAG3129593.1 hypothetical protein PI126_g20898 [Phytophthora idaei]KAG3233817.1 hypothetical protein PI124_g21120 [Phytophthora idaei]
MKLLDAVPSVRIVNITRTRMTKTSTTTIRLTMLAAMVHWSIMTATLRRLTKLNVAQLEKARTQDNRQPRGNIPDRERGFNQDRRGGERGFNQGRRGGERGFNQDRRGGDRSFGQDSRGRRDFNRDNRRPQYGPCAVCGGMNHSAHYCNKRCMFCKQANDASQCELFRNFQDLAKFVRIKGTKEELPLSSSLSFKSAI